jgi:glycosyltransferase involved in cell wall biosynthesis
MSAFTGQSQAPAGGPGALVSGAHSPRCSRMRRMTRGSSNISDEELLKLYRQTNLLFMPLKDATANNAVLEGIACGLPVLTTDLVSTREYLDHTDAVFVKNNEEDAFRTHILDLARDRDKCARYGESSRRRALDLSWPNVAKQYEKLYSMLIKKRG